MKKARSKERAFFLSIKLKLLRTAATAARTAAGTGRTDRHTGRRVEELLQERQFLAFRRRLARFEGDDMAVFQAIMADIRNAAILVEVHSEDGTRFDARIEEGDLLFDAGNVVPGIRPEGRLCRGIAQMLLDGRLVVRANPDRCLADGVGQIAALIENGRATNEKRRRKRKRQKLHERILSPSRNGRGMC